MEKMKKSYFLLIVTFILNIDFIRANVGSLVCFYDSASYVRQGTAKLSLDDLKPALQFCNSLVYGYAGIDRETFELKPLNASLDVEHYGTITGLKREFPNVRFLLSIGGDRDIDPEAPANKYLTLLEDERRRQTFVTSATNVARSYGFHGIDLAWQFPKNHAKKVRSWFGRAWQGFKGWFVSEHPVDEYAEAHKEQFSALVSQLRAASRMDLMLTLTVLPNVDAELFIDIPSVVRKLDYVSLGTFDFHTPEREPKEADHPAPINEIFERNPTQNIHYQVGLWLNNTAPPGKIFIGVPAFGRAWNMTKKSGLTGFPPVIKTAGPANGGSQLNVPGLLAWPEICEQFNEKRDLGGAEAPWRMVRDPLHRSGTYAYRAADDNDEHGIWVGYEEPRTAAEKAGYANAHELGGVALFDLSLDDFHGQCAGEKYPILRSIKYKL